VTTPGPGYGHFPIAYQQEFFNQLTNEEVRTHFVRDHPVRYWFKPSGKRNEALDRRVYVLAALHARRFPGKYCFARANRTAAAAAVTAGRRQPTRAATLIAAAGAGDSLRAPTYPL
jgi:phage terminase large subunit GpA-like protein